MLKATTVLSVDTCLERAGPVAMGGRRSFYNAPPLDFLPVKTPPTRPWLRQVAVERGEQPGIPVQVNT